MTVTTDLPTHVAYVTDCIDPTGGLEANNAVTRIATAVARELGASTSFVPVRYQGDCFDAALTTVDIAEQERQSSLQPPAGSTILLGNPAPRALTFGQESNGIRFCWCYIGDLFALIPFAPRWLSLAHRLGLINQVFLLDVEAVASWGVKHGRVTPDQADAMNSGFRGLTFVPRAARWILQDRTQVPHQVIDLGEPGRPEGVTARIDNFGNVYTDLLPEDVDFWQGRDLELVDGRYARCYETLAELPPDGSVGVAVSSSGYGDNKVLKLAIQGGSAAEALGITQPGQPVFAPSALLAGATA